MKRQVRGVLKLLVLALLLAPAAAAAQTAEEKVKQGVDLIGAGKADEAHTLLKQTAAELEASLKGDPKDAERWFLLGRACFYLGRDARALECFEKAATLAPKEPRYHFMKGAVLRVAGQAERAAKAFARARDLAPKKAPHWFELGEALLDQKKNGEALKCYRKTLELDPKHTGAMFKIGIVHTMAGDADAALKMFRNALEADANLIAAHYNVGQIHQARGELKAALESFQKVVRLDPNDWRARAKLVQIHQALGHQKKRDAARAALLDLRRKGKVPSLQTAESYCRDQFTAGGRRVMAYEHFELEGEWAVRYRFSVLDKTGKQTEYHVSLGSYEKTNDAARVLGQIKKGERLFHLDTYHPDGWHYTYHFFTGEPSYEETKKWVVGILEKKVKPTSGSKHTEEGSEILWEP